MGHSAFGKGFGQIEKVFDPSKIASPQDKAWSKIPNAIFDGLASRYKVLARSNPSSVCTYDLYSLSL